MRAETISTYPLPEAVPAVINEHFLRFAQGEPKGLEGLYQYYYPKLLRCGQRILYDAFAVNTIVQDAFLKAWTFRQRLTSALHAYRFMRMNITWDCYDYLRHHVVKDRKRLVYTDTPEYYDHIGYWEPGREEQDTAITEERLQTIYQLITHLPPERQTILTLYFKYELTYKQIARRFGRGHKAVYYELQRGLEYVKKAISPTHAPFDPSTSSGQAQLRVTASAARQPASMPVRGECLQGPQWQVFQLRYEMKWSFERIAQEVQLGQGEVVKLYIDAHKKLQQLHTNQRA